MTDRPRPRCGAVSATLRPGEPRAAAWLRPATPGAGHLAAGRSGVTSLGPDYTPWTRDAPGDRPRAPALCQSENHWKLGVSFIFPGVDLMVSCGIVSVSCSETEVYFAASESLSLNPLMTPVQK